MEETFDDLLGDITPPSVEQKEEVVAPTSKKKKAAKEKVQVQEDSQPEKVSENISATTEPAEDRVRIIIDQVKGMSNYETVGVNGRVYQIKRGEPVYVPQAVVNVLQDAVMTDTFITRHPITGERVEEVRHFSAIPWRRA